MRGPTTSGELEARPPTQKRVKSGVGTACIRRRQIFFPSTWLDRSRSQANPDIERRRSINRQCGYERHSVRDIERPNDFEAIERGHDCHRLMPRYLTLPMRSGRSAVVVRFVRRIPDWACRTANLFGRVFLLNMCASNLTLALTRRLPLWR